MTRVAVIDIGTVTARLAVAEVEEGHVTHLGKRSTIVNLGQDVDRTHRLAGDAVRRLLACVDEYVAEIAGSGVAVTCCTLTSAARDAENADELLGQLDQRGLRAQVIPGEVEGSLTFLGVAQDFPGKRILVADSGGGSTELACGQLDDDGLHLEFVRSTNVGARRVTEKFLSAQDPPSDEDLAAAHEFAARTLAPAIPWEPGASARPDTLVVTGGTATTLVAIEKELVPYDPSKVHLAELTRTEVLVLERELEAISVSERAELPGIQPKRAPVILGGTVTIHEIMRQGGFEQLTVSESDLLVGLSLVAAAAAEGAPSPLAWTPELGAVS